MHELREQVQEEVLTEAEMDHLLEFLGEWRKVRPDSRVWEHGAFSTLGSMLDKLTVDQLKVRNENPPPGRWM